MRIVFPEATKVHRRIPKEAFYKRLQLSAALKDKFISDVDRIFVENSLTVDSLNFTTEADVKEILLLSVTLKRKDFDKKIIEAIARQNPHQLVFLLIHDNECQLALYHKKLYKTEWIPDNTLSLELRGQTLDDIWCGLIEQIALYEERAETVVSETIEKRLETQEKILKLEKQIQKTEAAAWKEQQPKKRFELYSKLQEYKAKLEELKHGQS